MKIHRIINVKKLFLLNILEYLIYLIWGPIRLKCIILKNLYLFESPYTCIDFLLLKIRMKFQGCYYISEEKFNQADIF